MRVIIAGSRTIKDLALVERAITESGYLITVVISGGASGVDSLAIEYAVPRGIPYEIYQPDWNRYGKKAGPLRNLKMADVADALIAVWNGKSKGTLHMIETMIGRKKPLYIHKEPDDGPVPEES